MPRTCSKRSFGLAPIALAAALASGACSDGQGDGSPTAPTAPTAIEYPQVAGRWSGEWVVVELGPTAVRAEFSQSTSVVSGILEVEDVPLPIEGTLAPRDAAGGGILTWRVPDSALECGYVRGALAVSQGDTRMQGRATASSVGCDDQPETVEGTIALSRAAAAAIVDSRRPELAALLTRMLGGAQP